MRLSRLLLAALCCLGLSCLATIPQRATLAQGTADGSKADTQRGKQTPTPTPDVTSTVFDTSSTGDPLLLQSNDLYAAGAPGYAVYSASSSAGVISRIDSYGNSDWDLRLGDSTRGFYLTLNPVSGSGAAGLPSGPTFYNGQLISRCFDPSGATTNVFSWFSISGANPNCAMRVNFNYLGNGYSLVMSPYQAGTGRAEVYCNTISGPCVDWTILPNLNVSNATIANLLSINARNGKETLVGAYYLTFRVHVTAP